MHELKQKGIPTFGTRQERLDRLKKSYGKLCQMYFSENIF